MEHLPNGWQRLFELSAEEWRAIGLLVLCGLGALVVLIAAAFMGFETWRKLLN